MKYTHIEIGRTNDGRLSVALMNGDRRVGGTPNCSVEDACKAVRTVFGDTPAPTPDLATRHIEAFRTLKQGMRDTRTYLAERWQLEPQPIYRAHVMLCNVEQLIGQIEGIVEDQIRDEIGGGQ